MYSPGDLGTGKDRPNMAAYCSPDGSYAVLNVNYFLSPTCVDGFQIVEEHGHPTGWPPSDSYAHTEKLGPQYCQPSCRGGIHQPPTCETGWATISGAAPLPLVKEVTEASRDECETYVNTAEGSCWQACLGADIASALGLTEKGTCDQYKSCQKNSFRTRDHGSLTVKVCN